MSHHMPCEKLHQAYVGHQEDLEFPAHSSAMQQMPVTQPCDVS